MPSLYPRHKADREQLRTIHNGKKVIAPEYNAAQSANYTSTAHAFTQ